MSEDKKVERDDRQLTLEEIAVGGLAASAFALAFMALGHVVETAIKEGAEEVKKRKKEIER